MWANINNALIILINKIAFSVTSIKYNVQAQLDTVKIHVILMYSIEDNTKQKQGKHLHCKNIDKILSTNDDE